MHSLVLTFLTGLIGLVSVAFGFLYLQDKSTEPWYEVLKEDLPVRVVFWTVGLCFLAWGGYFQFRMM